jgi:hypothetical protein
VAQGVGPEFKPQLPHTHTHTHTHTKEIFFENGKYH